MADLEDVLFADRPALRDFADSKSGHIMIPCPYHGGGAERTPSCSVSRYKPTFFCHGCKVGGHISKLLRDLGASSEAIIRIRIESLGMSASPEHRGEGNLYSAKAASAAMATAQRRTNLDPFRGDFILNEDVLDPFREMPNALKKEGFSRDTLYHFEVGWDPRMMRITFPIRNVYGALVGISGRTLINAPEKYRIYTDGDLSYGGSKRITKEYTMEGTKKVVLWNIHSFHGELAATDEPVVIVEGFKACMWAWQSGYKLVTALIGSYLTWEHSELLARATSRIILCLDNNKAGIVGTHKAIQTLAKRGVTDVTVARYPDGREQPDDLEPEELLAAVRQPLRQGEWRRSL